MITLGLSLVNLITAKLGGGGVTLGPELTSEPNFATAGSWLTNGGWSLAPGQAAFDGVTSGNLSHNGVVENGKTYRIVITVSAASAAGNYSLRVGVGSQTKEDVPRSVGTYEYDVLSDGTSLILRSNSGNISTVTQFSVKEIL